MNHLQRCEITRRGALGLLLGAAALAIPGCSSSSSANDGGASRMASTSASVPPPLSQELQSQIDALAADGLKAGISGAIVGIDDPKLGRAVKAYGAADASGRTITTDMHYRIASVSKTFTALSVLRLVDAGKVSFDDVVSKFVSGIPNGSTITVRDLLSMRGGVFDFTGDPDFFARYSADPTLPGWTVDDTLAIIRASASMAATPNTKTVYSNSEYVLLSYVIEKASGQNAAEYIRTVIGTLGLSNTTFPNGDDLPSPFITGYKGTANNSDPYTFSGAAPSLPDASRSNPLVPWTAGALISTVPDMLTYAGQLANGAGLKPATAQLRQSWGPLTTSGPRLQYGLGITQLGDWVGHDGSIFGYSDLVFHLPSKQASVVVMVNEADGDAVPAQALWGKIVTLLYPGSIVSW